MQPTETRNAPGLCRYVGILETEGSKVVTVSRISGSSNERRARPPDKDSATCAQKWFKEYMTITNTAGYFQST